MMIATPSEKTPMTTGSEELPEYQPVQPSIAPTFIVGDQIDFRSLSNTHRLVHQTTVYRKAGVLDIAGWTELLAVVLDDCFVIAIPREKDGVKRYYVDQPPMILELLDIGDFNQAGVKKSKFSFRRSFDGSGGGASTTEQGQDGSVYPFSVQNIGRGGTNWQLYAESASARSELKQKLDDAIATRVAIQDSAKALSVEDCTPDVFAASARAGASLPADWKETEPTCVASYTCPANGRPMLLYGLFEGVWIGYPDDLSSFKRVLHLKEVTQCAILPDHGMLIVLAQKSLFAYDLNVLIPPTPEYEGNGTPQKLNGSKDVIWFSVGKSDGETCLIYRKPKGVDSVFRCLVPIKDLRDGVVERSDSIGPEWFKVKHDFLLQSTTYGLLFLKSTVAIMLKNGFEIMDVTNYKSLTVPQTDDSTSKSLRKRVKSASVLGLAQVNEDAFLMCYDEFGLYIDKQGNPRAHEPFVEWGGTANHVTVHDPYVVLFNERFIEIRYSATGELVQIIRAHHVKALPSLPHQVGPFSTGNAGIWATLVQQDKLDSAMLVRKVVKLVPTIP